MFLRNTEGHIYTSDSVDAGKTWLKVCPMDLPNNNNGIDIVHMDDGMLIFVYNTIAKTGD